MIHARTQRWSTELVLLIAIVFLVFRCPFNKVEESFNTQATHDILHYRWWHYDEMVRSFDHLEFPGVVPRTFIGPMILGIFTYPLKMALYICMNTLPKLSEQIIMRSVLGIWLWWCYCSFTRAISVRFGTVDGIDTGSLTSALTALQFHLPFYMSRTLPNTFALSGCLLAYSAWLHRKPLLSVCVIGAFAVLFRCDLLVLLGPLALQQLIAGEIKFWSTLAIGISVVLGALALTLCIDTYFWGPHFQDGSNPLGLVWPEGLVLFYNTVENKSSNWGTHVWHWYASSALPRALNVSLVLLVAGILGLQQPRIESTVGAVLKSFVLYFDDYNDNNTKIIHERHRRMLYYICPAFCFISLYSFLPHKELRFVFPAVPLLTLGAAVSLQRLLCTNEKARINVSLADASWMHKILNWTIRIGLLCLGIIALICYDGFLVAATHNYSGGDALHWLTRSEQGIAGSVMKTHYVHIAPDACMTGVSRFGQPPIVAGKDVVYSKEENLPKIPSSYDSFNWLLIGHEDTETIYLHDFEQVHVAMGFVGLKLNAHIRNTFACVLAALPSGASSSTDEPIIAEDWSFFPRLLPPYHIILTADTKPAIVVMRRKTQ